jgi:hypothetical protein
MVFKLINMKYILLNKTYKHQYGGEDIKCKKYLIPTTDWLIPIQPLNIDGFNNNGLILKSLLKNDNKEKNIIVKISKIDKYDDIHIKRIKVINNLLNNHNNFVKSYCVFTCLENKDNIDYYYLNIKDFCNKDNNNDNNNYKILLELQEYYKIGSLNKYIGKISLKELNKILRQLIYAQLEVFSLYGFVHNDVHLGNILLDYSDNYIDLNYSFIYNISIKTKKIFKFIDYDKSLLYNYIYAEKYDIDHLNLSKYGDLNYTLFQNILKTIYECLQLLNEDERDLFRNILDSKKVTIIYTNINRYNEKDYRIYYKNNTVKDYSFNDYVTKCINHGISYLNELWKGLYNEDFIDKFK